MKKILALLLIALMCLSLVGCGSSAELEKYKKYETLIHFLEAKDYQSAINEINKISGVNGSPNTGSPSSAGNTSQNAQDASSENTSSDSTDYEDELIQLLCEKNVWYGTRHGQGKEEELTFFADGHFEKNGSRFNWQFEAYHKDATEFLANHAFQTTPNYDAKRGLYVTNEFLLGYDIDGNLLLYWRDYFCYNESQYKTVELTLENWQEYFEIRPCTHGALYSSFGEFERLDYVNWALYLKEDVADTVIDMEDAAIEYSFRDGYFCRFEYNLDTGEFVQKEAAVPGEIDSNLKVTDSARDLRINLASAKEDGCFLVFISRHLAETLNENIYSFIGEAYATMEIVRIKGTLTVTK